MNLEYKNNSLVGLLQDLKVKVCSYLSPSEILNFSLTNKSNSELLKQKALYQVLFEFYCPESYVIYPGNQQEGSKASWNSVFSTYKNLIRLVHGLTTKIGDNNLEERHFWSSVASANRKKDIESRLKAIGVKLPLDCYILYRIAHGSDEFEKNKIKNIEEGFMFDKIFGSFNYYNQIFLWNLTSIPKQIKKTGNFVFFPMFKSYDRHHSLFIDINNQFGKGAGAIYSMINRREDPKVNKIWVKVFIYKKSLTALLEEASKHPFDEKRGFIDLCDTLDTAKGDCTTHGIRVRANCFFSAWDRSYQDNELFSYQIRYSDNGVQGKYKLTTRHWIIVDRGENRYVDGPGVIGYHPEVFKGSEDFYYESCSPMYDFTGSIKGKFKFKDMSGSGEEIEVIAPEMKFEFPKGSALLEFSATDFEIKNLIDRLNE